DALDLLLRPVQKAWTHANRTRRCRARGRRRTCKLCDHSEERRRMVRDGNAHARPQGEGGATATGVLRRWRGTEGVRRAVFLLERHRHVSPERKGHTLEGRAWLCAREKHEERYQRLGQQRAAHLAPAARAKDRRTRPGRGATRRGATRRARSAE